jgi:hypothetical protein
MYATSTNTSSPMPSGLWEPVQDNPYFCYGYGIQHGVTIYNASDTSVRFQDINGAQADVHQPAVAYASPGLPNIGT